MLINLCKLSLKVSRVYAYPVQQEASELFRFSLKEKIFNQLKAWEARQFGLKAEHIESLCLNVGVIPLSQFKTLFVPRVLEALEEALRNYSLTETLSLEKIFEDDLTLGNRGDDEKPLPENVLTEHSGADDLTTFFENNSLTETLSLEKIFEDDLTLGNRGDDEKPLPENVLTEHSGADDLTTFFENNSLTETLSFEKNFEDYLTLGNRGDDEKPPHEKVLTEHTYADDLTTFLETGYWPVSQGEVFSSPKALLVSLVSKHPEFHAVFWQQLELSLVTPQARQRLLSTLPHKHWTQFMHALQRGLFSNIYQSKPDAVDFVIQLFRLRLSLKRKAYGLNVFSKQEVTISTGNQVAELKSLIEYAVSISALKELGDWLKQVMALNTHLKRRLSPPIYRFVQQAVTEAEMANDAQHKEGSQRLLSFPGKKREDELRVHHAGLVLLWPLLARWWNRLGLMTMPHDDIPLQFVSTLSQMDAIAFLDVLIWQDEEGGEWRSTLSKLLCGWPLSVPLDGWPEPERIAELSAFAETCLHDTVQQIQQIQFLQSQSRPGLNQLSVRDVCQLFLQRGGVLKDTQNGWQLTVAPHPSDILLWGIPWPIEQIVYPWLPEPLNVKWDRASYDY